MRTFDLALAFARDRMEQTKVKGKNQTTHYTEMCDKHGKEKHVRGDEGWA